MNSKKLVLTGILTTLLCHNIGSAMAQEEKFKVAIIKNAIGSKSLLAGDFERTIATLSTQEPDKTTVFEQAMALCVAHLKSGNFTVAEHACSQAIDENQGLSGRGRANKRLQAYAYNNRAIVRYMADDFSGALSDFAAALTLAPSTAIKDNLHKLNDEMTGSLVQTTARSAD